MEEWQKIRKKMAKPLRKLKKDNNCCMCPINAFCHDKYGNTDCTSALSMALYLFDIDYRWSK